MSNLIVTCPYCGKEISVTMKREIISKEHRESFYGDGPTFHSYKLNDGREVKEVLQAEPWSSGPVAFFCLEVDGVRMFEWTEKEIEENL